MKKQIFVLIVTSLMGLPLILQASSSQERQSNERNLYDENRARVDRQIWHDEHQFHPDYWTDEDYLYTPKSERYRYNPKPLNYYPQSYRQEGNPAVDYGHVEHLNVNRQNQQSRNQSQGQGYYQQGQGYYPSNQGYYQNSNQGQGYYYPQSYSGYYQ